MDVSKLHRLGWKAAISLKTASKASMASLKSKLNNN